MDRLTVDTEQFEVLKKHLDIQALTRLGIYAEWDEAAGIHVFDATRLRGLLLLQFPENGRVQERLEVEELPSLEDSPMPHEVFVAGYTDGETSLAARAPNAVLALIKLLAMVNATRGVQRQFDEVGI